MFDVRGQGMVLRPPREEDADALFALGSDAEVTRWFSWGPYAEREEALAYVERARVARDVGLQLDLLVVDDVHGPIGITGLSEHSARDRRAIVGTWLGREHWGTGANARSKALVLTLAFRELGLVRVGAYADVRNGRSQRALEKIGFEREGVLRAWHRHGDVQKDVAIYGLLASDHPPDPGIVVDGILPPAFLQRT